jgi:hypothetical protein
MTNAAFHHCDTVPDGRGKFEAQSKITSLLRQQRSCVGLLGILVSPNSPRDENKGPTGKKPVGPKKYV